MTQTVQAQIAYFGKIPSRGDFVKSAHNPQLLQTLDRWIAEAMELLTDAAAIIPAPDRTEPTGSFDRDGWLDARARALRTVPALSMLSF